MSKEQIDVGSRKRSTSLTLTAIGAIVVAALSLVFILGEALFWVREIIRTKAGTGPPDSLGAELENSLPGATILVMVLLAVRFLLHVALLAGAIGLLRLKKWAWWTCLTGAIVSLGMAIIVGGFYLVVVDFAIVESQPGALIVPMMLVIRGGTTCFNLVFSIVLLVMLLLPGLRGAIYPTMAGSRARETDDDTSEDSDDSRRGIRRRRPRDEEDPRDLPRRRRRPDSGGAHFPRTKKDAPVFQVRLILEMP